MRVLVIDPVGTYSPAQYTHGLCSGLSKLDGYQVTLFTNYYYPFSNRAIYTVGNFFYRRSENRKRGLGRNIVRGIEYITAYMRIVSLLRGHPFDVIHIQWLQLYPFDILVLKYLKRYCSLLVYTAHNVIPHVDGMKQVKALQKIYSLVDRLVVHGSNIRKELDHIFEIPSCKVIIQKHGAKDPKNDNRVDYDIRLISDDIKGKITNYDKKFLFIGDMHYNKGVDRLIKAWAEIGDRSCLLIIAGQKTGRYKELEDLESLVSTLDNILYIDHFIEDNLLNYFLSSVDCVLLPYRHASMSGVIFSAAQFRKAILCTDVGALSEYVLNGKTGFVINNTDESLKNALIELIYTVSKEELKKMGEANFHYVNREFNWDKIAKDLSVKCYGGASPMGGKRNAGADIGWRNGKTVKEYSE